MVETWTIEILSWKHVYRKKKTNLQQSNLLLVWRNWSPFLLRRSNLGTRTTLEQGWAQIFFTYILFVGLCVGSFRDNIPSTWQIPARPGLELWLKTSWPSNNQPDLAILKHEIFLTFQPIWLIQGIYDHFWFLITGRLLLVLVVTNIFVKVVT